MPVIAVELNNENQDDLLAVLKALADGSRLRILGLLSRREMSVGAIAQELALSEPTISHHLARLVSVDFVRARHVGTSHIYSLDADRLAGFQRALATRSMIAPATGEAATGSAESAKVLKSFVKNGKLVKIPEALKKRRVVLAWLVDKLEFGRRYPEKEVNAFLKQFHEDFATLRRELVDGQFMRREESIYWRS
jgi:predicted transcriptional regulator